MGRAFSPCHRARSKTWAVGPGWYAAAPLALKTRTLAGWPATHPAERDFQSASAFDRYAYCRFMDFASIFQILVSRFVWGSLAPGTAPGTCQGATQRLPCAAYGKSCHHWIRPGRLDGGVVHRTGAARAAGAHGPATRRAAHHHQHRREFSRLSRRRGRLRTDDPHAEAGGALRRQGQLWRGGRGGFLAAAVEAGGGWRTGHRANRHYCHRRRP